MCVLFIMMRMRLSFDKVRDASTLDWHVDVFRSFVTIVRLSVMT